MRMKNTVYTIYKYVHKYTHKQYIDTVHVVFIRLFIDLVDKIGSADV